MEFLYLDSPRAITHDITPNYINFSYKRGSFFGFISSSSATQNQQATSFPATLKFNYYEIFYLGNNFCFNGARNFNNDKQQFDTTFSTNQNQAYQLLVQTFESEISKINSLLIGQAITEFHFSFSK